MQLKDAALRGAGLGMILGATHAVIANTPAQSQEVTVLSIAPTSGPPRTIVEIDVSDPDVVVVWDAGTPTEKELPRSAWEPVLVSIPTEATMGTHRVSLSRAGEHGPGVDFEVTAAQPFAPRLERVSLAGTEFTDDGQLTTDLLVQGANLDVGAQLFVRPAGTSAWAAVPSSAASYLRKDLLGVSPEDLAFPIQHFVLLWAIGVELPAGASIEVKVRNLDLEEAELEYALPVDEENLDSDGDALYDHWELDGYDGDDGSFDLPAHGADPYRPDVFVEVDVMRGLEVPPTPAVFQAVTNAFARAPILNPFGASGIALHVTRFEDEARGSVPFNAWITFEDGAGNFYDQKQQDTPLRTHHYCIWAHKSSAPGESDCLDGNGDVDVGSNFFVAIDNWSELVTLTVRDAAEIFMHELGHDLGQRHGGETNATYNPVYSSAMSYSWTFRTMDTGDRCFRKNLWVATEETLWDVGPCWAPIHYDGADCAVALGCGCLEEEQCDEECADECWSDTCGDKFDADEWRSELPVYAPFYYGYAGAHESDGALPQGFDEFEVRLNYSDGMGRRIDESAASEPVGVYGQRAVDWNANGDTDVAPVTFDIDYDFHRCNTLDDYPNWIRLKYHGIRQAAGGS